MLKQISSVLLQIIVALTIGAIIALIAIRHVEKHVIAECNANDEITIQQHTFVCIPYPIGESH